MKKDSLSYFQKFFNHKTFYCPLVLFSDLNSGSMYESNLTIAMTYLVMFLIEEP